MSPQFSEAFDWIRQYAVREGWVPIGWRDWMVGPWRIRVNGTATEQDHIPPYHALIEHQELVAILLIHPRGGTVGGWQDAELEFCQAMQHELQPAARGEGRP